MFKLKLEMFLFIECVDFLIYMDMFNEVVILEIECQVFVVIEWFIDLDVNFDVILVIVYVGDGGLCFYLLLNFVDLDLVSVFMVVNIIDFEVVVEMLIWVCCVFIEQFFVV